MTANSIVGINALNKWYGDFHVLRDIQLEGKRRMPAREFLLGHRVATGTVLSGGAGS